VLAGNSKNRRGLRPRPLAGRKQIRRFQRPQRNNHFRSVSVPDLPVAPSGNRRPMDAPIGKERESTRILIRKSRFPRTYLDTQLAAVERDEFSSFTSRQNRRNSAMGSVVCCAPVAASASAFSASCSPSRAGCSSSSTNRSRESVKPGYLSDIRKPCASILVASRSSRGFGLRPITRVIMITGTPTPHERARKAMAHLAASKPACAVLRRAPVDLWPPRGKDRYVPIAAICNASTLASFRKGAALCPSCQRTS
jgi:hypothetical protein